MSRILFGTVILQVLLLCSIEGLILPGYSKPRPVTKAEQAEFYSVIATKFRKSGINLYGRRLVYIEVATRFYMGTYYRFKMMSWRRRCWYIVVFKSLPRPRPVYTAQTPVSTKC
ncbi:hypothetical protein FBUS_03195 [Fasciolopsis buskii]|uniref:Uncharacterized protein n=1 Tax=Fasciolopsis buskii TaxID=27845 RepID=A0A8E0S2K4_9TREM|nr:hypothetical protein FBUS_03195 [Fasciolopsis buski]